MISLIFRLVLNALVLLFAAWIVPGFEINGFWAAVLLALVFGLVNAFIKPVLLFVTLPITFMTLGLFMLIINTLMLWLAGSISSGCHINGFWAAFFGALVISVLNYALYSSKK